MEIEIKLGPVNRETAARVFADPVLAPCLNAGTMMNMHTVYYDDPARSLRRDRITLRLRKEGTRSVCTLKTGSIDEAGIATRLEIEQEADNINQGLAALMTHPELPQELKPRLLTGSFEPTCGARFVRRENRVTMEDVVFLLSWDQGELYAGENTAPLSEIELEFCSGSVEALVREARRLMEVYGLPFCKDSKQKRAAALEGK